MAGLALEPLRPASGSAPVLVLVAIGAQGETRSGPAVPHAVTMAKPLPAGNAYLFQYGLAIQYDPDPDAHGDNSALPGEAVAGWTDELLPHGRLDRVAATGEGPVRDEAVDAVEDRTFHGDQDPGSCHRSLRRPW